MTLLIVIILGIAALLLGITMKQNQPNCPAPPAPSPQILSMALAIQAAENSPAEWNNPGDLTASFGYPTVGVANSAGVLKFQNCMDGWNALYKQLGAIVNGTSRYSLQDTLATFGMGYSGGDPNWAQNVASKLGVTIDTPLGDLLV